MCIDSSGMLLCSLQDPSLHFGGEPGRSRASGSRDHDVLKSSCGRMTGLCGVNDWHAHEVIKEEPARVALNKAPLSLVGHYMSQALASKAQPCRALHFPSLTHCC